MSSEQNKDKQNKENEESQDEKKVKLKPSELFAGIIDRFLLEGKIDFLSLNEEEIKVLEGVAKLLDASKKWNEIFG